MIRVSVKHTRNLRNPDEPWCLQWQTGHMPAPAFWYYRTKPAAEAASFALRHPKVQRYIPAPYTYDEE
jgi:hypothetical protein